MAVGREGRRPSDDQSMMGGDSISTGQKVDSSFNQFTFSLLLCAEREALRGDLWRRSEVDKGGGGRAEI